MQPPSKLLLPVFALIIATQISFSECFAGSQKNDSQVLEQLKGIDHCVTEAMISFVYPESYPPDTQAKLQKQCKDQTEAFKCIKEKSRQMPALLKRGFASVLSNRQRFHKKYCTNPTSEVSRKFVEANKCIMERKLKSRQKIDSNFANTLIAIRDKHYTNTSDELAQFCCATFVFRRESIQSVEPECAFAKPIYEELFNSIISSEVSLICEDEDKMMATTCPKLEKLGSTKQFVPSPGNSPSLTALYLIATLGE